MSHTSPTTILYVDDDETTRNLFAQFLREEGFQVLEAESGRQALRLAAEKPNLVILDVQLPDLSGFEVCRRIKSNPTTAGIPVLHLSGVYIGSQDKARALEGGADGYMSKPALPQEVVAQVKALLRVREAEEMAQATAQQWQATFDALSDGVCLLDREGRVLRCNRALGSLLGQAPANLVGRHYPELLRETLGPQAVLSRAPRGEVPVREVVEFPGNERWWRATTDPVFDRAGVVTGAVHVLTDSTQRRHAEEALRQARDFAEILVQTAQVVVLVLDREGRIVRFNLFLEELSGHSLAEVRDQDGFITFFAENDRPLLRDLFDKAMAGVPGGGHVYLAQHREGKQRDIDWHAQALRDAQGAVMGVLFIGHDVTDLKQAQARALQIERLAAIGEMLPVLAHESRNALQEAQACLELLRWQLEGQPSALDLVERLQRQQDRLHRLHEDLRGYVAPLQLRRHVCNLAEIWRKAWADLTSSPAAQEASLSEHDGGLDLNLAVDPFRLEQVFRNLLDNSFAACAAPVRIAISCSEATLAGQPALQIAVRDNGPGLNAEQRQQIFMPFYTTKTQGTGLGLSISKRIVEAHGGELAVGAAVEPGTEILITLPRRKP